MCGGCIEVLNNILKNFSISVLVVCYGFNLFIFTYFFLCNFILTNL